MNLFCRNAMCIAVFCLAVLSAQADVTILQSFSGGNNSNNDEFTISVTVPPEAEVAIVGVSNSNARNVSWVRFDGQSNMTSIISSTSSPHEDMDERAQLFYFLNPPAGTYTLRVKMSGDARHKAVGCLLLAGIDASAMGDIAAKADENFYDDNPNPTLSFTGAEAPTGSLAVSVINNQGNGLSITGANHTVRWNIETTYTWGVNSRHGGGTAPGSSENGVSLSWSPSATWPYDANWGMVAAVIPAAYYGIVNVAPNTFSVNDTDPDDTVIGTLTATDADNKPPYTWTLLDSAGGRFALNPSDTLDIDVRMIDASLIDFGQNETHTIRVGVHNAEYAVAYEKDITINVVDTTPPVIGPISSSRQFARWGEFVSFSTTITDNAGLAGMPVMSLNGSPLTFSNQAGDVYTWGWNVPLDFPDDDLAVTVTAEDTSGNETVVIAENMLTVDNTPPDISALDVSGEYVKLGDTVEISVDILDANGIAEYPTATLDGVDGGVPVFDGVRRYTWAFGIDAQFEEGPADILITAYDPAGNQAQGSGPGMVTVDNTAPVITSFVSSHEYAKLDDVVTLRASVLDNYGLDGPPRMYLHGNMLPPPSASGNTYYWQVQITNVIQQGDAVIAVEATDHAGNTATASPASTILVIDYTRPNIFNLTVSPSLAKGGTVLNLSAMVIDNYGLVTTPAMSINGWPVPAPSQSGNEFFWTYTVPTTPTPQEGPAEITILATDFAGNTRVLPNSSLLTYDPNAPVSSNVLVVPAIARRGQSVTITVNVYDISPLDGLPTLTVSGLAATHMGVTDLGGHNKLHSFAFPITGATPEGDSELVFWGKDILGNERTMAFTDKLLVDKTPPEISNVSTTPNTSRAGGVVTITFDAEDALTEVHGIPSVTVNGASAAFHAQYGKHYQFRYTVRSPEQDPDGPASIVISSRDTVGNAGSVEHSNLLYIDNTKPVVTDLSVFPNFARDGDTVTIAFKAFDDSGLGAMPVVRVNGNPTTFVAGHGTAYEYQYTLLASSDVEGYAQIYIRVTDTVGNVLESESSGLLLVDFTPPSGTLSINDNATLTRMQEVTLGISADDGPVGAGVSDMSFSDDGTNWTPWEPVAPAKAWQLKAGQGYRTLYMRLRDHAGNISTTPMSATIALKPDALVVDRDGSGEVKALPGYAVLLEVTPRNIFGSIQSYEWFKDGQPIEGFGPVLAIENFEEEDMGVYVCRVTDEVEMAESPPFEVGISEETPVPALSKALLGIALLLLALVGARSVNYFGGKRAMLVLLVAVGLFVPAWAGAEVTVVYSAIASEPTDLSDAALFDLALEKGTIEIWTKREDGTVRRQLARLGEPNVGNPGFSSHHREDFAEYVENGYDLEKLKDGSEQLQVPLAEEAVIVYTQNHDKGQVEPSFEMALVVDGETIVSEKRYEELINGVMRPTMLRVDYPGGAIIQVYEFTDSPPPALPPVYLRKVGVDDDEKSDTYPKSWATKDVGDAQTREVQFIVPPQGLGSLGFDSGWVPGGEGAEPGGFIIQVRINATAGYTYDAAVNGSFHLDVDSLLLLGPAAGSWGFYFGAEFFMKAAFNLPPILGFEIPPFIVDIPYVPDFNMVASDRDSFNSWLLEEVSTVRDEGGRTQVTSVDLVALLITQGVLPELPSWVPLPKVGAALDVGAVANGYLTCDSVALSDGTVFTQEAQALPIYVPQSGYQAIAEYNEDAELNLGVKFYPYVFFSWFSFGFSWPTDFDDPDNLLARLEWLPVSHKSFPFSNAELNFTGQPSTQPANDWFTQHFQPIIDTNNVSYKQVRFTPNLSNNFYTACVGNTAAYRTPPDGGIPVTLDNNDYAHVQLTDNKRVSLYGVSYDSFYIGSNGYITFNEGDTTAAPSLENHFNQPRISGLFLDLKPHEGGAITYKQLPNRVVVTYHGVRLSNVIVEQKANFQIEMFFDGRIVITWLQLDTYIGLIGLSRGLGVPEDYQKSRFTNYPGCLTGIADEYGVRMHFEPPEVLPYSPQWRVGAGAWLPGDTYTSVPMGSNWIYFNHIPIYWESPETMSVHSTTPDAFIDVTGGWNRATGTVNVSPNQGTASWIVTDADGNIHEGAGPEVLEAMPTGITAIEWLPVATYSLPTPPTAQATLYPDMSVSFSGNYTPIIGEGQATLIIHLAPERARAAGAQWRVNEGEWLDSGVEATIPDGDSIIEFKPINGWTRPAAQSIFFHRDTTTELFRGYSRHLGSVLIDPTPNNAPWILTDGDGEERVGVGYTGLQNIPTGDNLTVFWGDVAGYLPPEPNPTVFSLEQSPVKRVTGTYIPIIGDGEGIVRVTLRPPAAVAAGAQWRLFGGEWQSSEGMVASADGEQTLLFSDVPGWIAPETITVSVEREVTNEYSATYERLTGTVVIDIEPASGYYTLTDSDGGTHSQMGSATLSDIPAGEISVLWGELEGYAPPQPNPAAYTLEAGETLHIQDAYTQSVVKADFSAYPLTGTPPLEVNFSDISHSTTKEIIEWRWYFGDGRMSMERHPTHVYREPGTYTVTLSVSTQDQLDVISRKQLITVTEGMPVSGPVALVAVGMLIGLGGIAGMRRKRR